MTRSEEKLEEICSDLRAELLKIGIRGTESQADAAVEIIRRALSVTDPEAVTRTIGMIHERVSSDGVGGASIRPGHIRFRLGDALEACGSGAGRGRGLGQPVAARTGCGPAVSLPVARRNTRVDSGRGGCTSLHMGATRFSREQPYRERALGLCECPPDALGIPFPD